MRILARFLLGIALFAAHLSAGLAQSSEWKHGHGPCGRVHGETSSICDPFHVLAEDAYSRIDLLARALSSSGLKITISIIKHIDTKIKQHGGNFAIAKSEVSHDHQAACDLAEKTRVEWGSDIVLLLLDGKNPSFCISSVAPPLGVGKSQIDYIQNVAYDSLQLGLHEPAITFALLRIQSLRPNVGKAKVVLKPSRRELIQVFFSAMLPFIGFGILDNGLMIIYGDLIEEFLGRFFPISTMAAAAVGNLISDIIGIYAAGGVKFVAEKLGAMEPDLTREQKQLPLTRNLRTLGESLGITTGCLLGMTPLLLRGVAHEQDDLPPLIPISREGSTLENIKC